MELIIKLYHTNGNVSVLHNPDDMDITDNTIEFVWDDYIINKYGEKEYEPDEAIFPLADLTSMEWERDGHMFRWHF